MTERSQPSPRFENFPNLEGIPNERFPKHVLIIPDGNRTFARNNGQELAAGHERGLEVALDLLRKMRELPVEVVTLWGFSADNWKRDPQEVRQLMAILNHGINDNLEELIGHHNRFVHLGRKDRIPPQLASVLREAEARTADNRGKTICLAIDFGGEDQDVRINQQSALYAAWLVRKAPTVSDETIRRSIDQRRVSSFRDGEGKIPPANLLIRTSQNRTSDIGWLNGRETEIYFVDKLFPELTVTDVELAIKKYSQAEQKRGS
jgi:undecaprenyl diphosphate synthase